MSKGNQMSLNKKKVRFDSLPTIFYVKSECEIYRQRYWETFATDRGRFKDKINQYNIVLSPVLSLIHRERVFKKLDNSW